MTLSLIPLLLIFADPIAPAPSKDFTREQQLTAILATVRVINGTEQGTGIMIRQRGAFVYALTAAHVVGQADAVEVSIFSGRSYPKPEKVIKNAEVVVRIKDADVALLRIPMREAAPALVPLCPANAIPNKRSFPALLTGCSEGAAPTVVEETVAGKKLVRRPNTTESLTMWEVGRAPPKGRSGGPLIDRQGRLLGLCSGRSGAKGYYVHIDEIRAGLRDTGFRWLLDDQEKKG